MFVVWLIVFSAVFAFGHGTGPWEGFSRQADERQAIDDLRTAETLRREAIRLAENELGLVDKQLVPLLVNLAVLLHFEAKDSEAEPVTRRALAIAEQANDAALKGISLNALGVVLSAEGDRSHAESFLRRSLVLMEDAEGPDSLNAAKAANNLASLYCDTRQYAKAERQMERALPVYEHHFSSDDPALVLALSNMFTALAGLNRDAEGEVFLRRALAIAAKNFPHSLKMANLQHSLASLEAKHQNFPEAGRLLETVLNTQERLLGPDHPDLGRTLVEYSAVLRHMHLNTEAKNAQNRANLILKSVLNDVK